METSNRWLKSATASSLALPVPSLNEGGRRLKPSFIDAEIRQTATHQGLKPAASIWFEILGVVDPGDKNFDISRQTLTFFFSHLHLYFHLYRANLRMMTFLAIYTYFLHYVKIVR